MSTEDGHARPSRRLAAILAADIAGYSTLMGADEARTVQDLKGHQAIVLPMIGQFGGRIIDTAGDGILAEFPSVVNAVECAVAVQKVLAERNASIPIERQMRYRIGVNLGDVIHDEQRVYGDGVNIAARLESIAEPGGVCISGEAFAHVQRKLQFQFVDMGEHQLKNITAPIRVYRVDTAQRISNTSPAKPTLTLPDKPSIAVLPFTNLSGDPDQEYFGDGIAEDILTDLAKLRWLFVIARNSSFTFRGKAVDIRAVSREVGVRYVLEGSVRRAGNRMRVTGQLIDATTGAHVWASRYDRDLADIFAVQDEITAAIAAAIAPAIIDAEQQRALRKSAERLDAWEAYHRGMWHFAIGNPENCEMARGFCQKAVHLDPNFAAAHVALAGIALRSGIVLQTMSLDEAARAGKQLAQKALSLDPSDPLAHARLAQAVWAAGDLEGCIAECNEALSLDGNCAIAHGVKGDALVFFAGRREEGRASIRTYLRLSPRDPARAARLHNIALSHYLDGNYEVAAEACGDVIRRYGHGANYKWLLASLGQLGRPAECEALMKIAPPDYDHYARHRPPWFGLKDFEHMLEGLRKAGWSA